MSYIKVLFTMTCMLASSRVTFTKSLPLSAVQPRNSHQVVEMQQTGSLQEHIPDAVEALKTTDEGFHRDSFTVAEVPGSFVSSLDAEKSATGESSEEPPPVDREMAKTKASTISRSKRAAQPRLYDILAISDAEATKIDEDIDTPYPIMERPTAQQRVFRPMVKTVRDRHNSDNPRRFPSHISQKRCGDCEKTRCAREGGICKQIYHQTDILQGYYSAIRGETVYRMESINVPVACTCYKK